MKFCVNSEKFSRNELEIVMGGISKFSGEVWGVWVTGGDSGDDGAAPPQSCHYAKIFNSHASAVTYCLGWRLGIRRII